MKIADMSTGVGQLRDAIETLQQAWWAARETWNDANSRNLEENHLRPLNTAVNSAYPAIQHLGAALTQAERECGWWSS